MIIQFADEFLLNKIRNAISFILNYKLEEKDE